MTIRREPTQARSRKLVDSVLDAAIVLLRQNSPADINTSALAAAAGCSPAGMFRFFPDKESIFSAASERLQLALRDRYQAALADTAATPTINDAVETLIAITVEFMRGEPAFRSLRWGVGSPDGGVVAAFRATNEAVADQMFERFGSATLDRHAFGIAVETAGHLIGVAFEHDLDGDRATIQHATVMVQRFLAA